MGLVMTGIAVGAPPPAYADTTTDRLHGKSRYETAAAVAVRAFPGHVDRVYLARADSFPDALAAGALRDGPVLLVPRAGAVPPSVTSAIAALSPGTVVALGGEAVVSDGVLRAAAGQRSTDRIAGPTRYETSVAISRTAFPSGARTAYLARADAFPDALAAGVLTDGPVLLVPRTGTVPAAVLSEIDRLRPGRVVALGSTAAVSDAVLAAVARGTSTGRLAGENRYATAARISAAAFPAGARTVYLARADAFPDALAAGALTDGPLLLVPSCGALPTPVTTELRRLQATAVIALGGPGAVCDAVLRAAAGGVSAVGVPSAMVGRFEQWSHVGQPLSQRRLLTITSTGDYSYEVTTFTNGEVSGQDREQGKVSVVGDRASFTSSNPIDGGSFWTLHGAAGRWVRGPFVFTDALQFFFDDGRGYPGGSSGDVYDACTAARPC